MADAPPPTTRTRRPYKGSCHCGATRFVVFLTLPHVPSAAKGVQSIYRCNCTVCHKAGFFHMRVDSSPDDFLVLSPRDPVTELGDYQCGEKSLHFLFCKTCAVRCFIFMGEGEQVEVDLGELGVEGYEKGVKTAVWRPKKEGWKEGKAQHGCYLSVNGYTVDANQEGFELGDITDSKVVGYIDYLKSGEEGMGHPRLSRPHQGGAY